MRPSTTSNWLYQEIRKHIISGYYGPNEAIPQEEIASLHSVSRMPVREALRLLEAEGLIVQFPHRGAFVAPLDAGDAYELFGIRAALESFAASESVPKLSDAHVETIEMTHKAFVAASDELSLELHREFHLSLYAASGVRLRRLIREQLDAAERYHLRFGRQALEVSVSDRKEHQSLVKAAKQRDGVTAATILRRHILGGGKLISKSISEQQHSPS